MSQAALNYAQLAMELNHIAKQMTLNGIKTDAKAIQLHKDNLSQTLHSSRKQFADIAGQDFQLTAADEEGEPIDGEAALGASGQNDALNELFFSKWKITPRFFSKKTGKPSLNKDCLHDLLATGEVKPKAAARVLLVYREAAKTLQFLDKLVPLINTTWNVCSTKTMRWSEGPYGIQRIKRPKTDAAGNIISAGLKNCFVPDNPNLFFISADKSQIDLRIVSCLANDKPLLNAFATGAKIHKMNSMDLFGTDSGTAYDMAKIFCYSVVYDAVAETVYRQMVIKFPSITLSFIKALIVKWFKAHPALVAYKEEQLDFVKKNGYSWLPLSDMRFYYYLGAAKPSEVLAQRVSRTTADDMNPATLRVARALTEEEQLKAQVHDELLCQGADVKTLGAKMKTNMDTIFHYKGRSVSLPVEVKAGKSWGSMEPVK